MKQSSVKNTEITKQEQWVCDSHKKVVYQMMFKKMVIVLFCIAIPSHSFSQVNVMVAANPPVNPFVSFYVSSPSLSLILNSTDQLQVSLSGEINCLSCGSFKIALKPGIRHTVTLFKGANIISANDKTGAFGSFFVDSLDISGFDVASITDGSGRVTRLPDGNYNICYSALDGNNSVISTSCANFTIGCGVLINTIVIPPFNPLIRSSVLSGAVSSTIQIRNPSQCNAQSQVKLFGKVECLSPSPFTIALNPNYGQQTPINVMQGAVKLSTQQLIGAFSDFNESNLIITGIDLAAIKDATGNIRLPSGNYRICFYARYVNPTSGTPGANASDPNLGCGTFTICSGAEGAPQFTQPVNNMDITSSIGVVQPASPVIFTWTPPQSACGLPAGGLTYSFEIRELFNNQNVNDAVNDPFVFQKTLLPSTTFLLDTNLYKGVLQVGKRYAIRVRAIPNNTGANFEIDNNGYSRVEAFQYGSNTITQSGIPDPQDYYIPFGERKSDFWEDVYEGYKSHRRTDTLVPVKEYIAFALTQNGTAYNTDAIELFLALNPELADLKKVKISYTPRLPELPPVPVNDRKNFDKEHEASLEPDKTEENKFLKYLDTLDIYKQKISGNSGTLINDLAGYLGALKPQVTSVDRVTINLINQVLSELLYELRQYKSANKNQYNQLESLGTALRELTASSPNSTSFYYPFGEKERSSLSSYQPGSDGHKQKISLRKYLHNTNETDSLEHLLANIMKQLRSYDVIVWRNSTIAPYKPVLDAPDLTATYRIFYTLSNLYNHKNPEVNAKSTSRLASTVQVSLPSNAVFTFWTLNMINHKMTRAEDVDLKNVLLYTDKISPQPKKLSIILKVD